MRRTGGFSLIELMVIVAMLGILASVAIPAYIKYIRRSYTVEASLNLRRMYDGAVAYYVGEHSNSVGAILSRQFPGTAGPTPAAPPSAIKYQPTPTDFDTPEWNALDFAVRDPMRYSYSFINTGGTGSSAFGFMTAQGDLDGDGSYSLFQRSLQGVQEGVLGGSGLVSMHEIE
jgi:type II secretory pathway pseudopilin PulG